MGTQVESQRPIIKSYVDSVEIVKLQKFSVALYDRIEQLELENDSIRNELSSISARLASLTDNSPSLNSLPIKKSKRIRTKKVESVPSVKISPFSALSSAVTTAAHAEPSNSNSALEIASWTILNGRNPSGAIKLLSQSIAL